MTFLGPGFRLARVAVRRGNGLDMTYVSAPGLHCYRRLFEWMATLMMLGIACLALLPGSGVPIAFALAVGVIACVRASALYLNGKWPITGPRCRAFCALLGAFIWLQMMMVLSRHGGILPIELPVYLCLTLGEIVTCYRSAADVRHRE